MGALDPLVHKRNQQRLSDEQVNVTRRDSDPGQHTQSLDELSMEYWPSFVISEDYYSRVISSYPWYIDLLYCQNSLDNHITILSLVYLTIKWSDFHQFSHANFKGFITCKLPSKGG